MRGLLLLLVPALLSAQGVGQVSPHLVLTQDIANPAVRGAGVALVAPLVGHGNWALAVSGGAVKVAGEWSQGAGLDLVRLIPLPNPRLLPYIAAEWNQTRVGGAFQTGYVAFVGLSVNDMRRERTNWRGQEVTPSWVHEARYGWLAGGRYLEYDLGYAP